MLPSFVNEKPFRQTKFRLKETILSNLRVVFADEKSRNLFFFLVLNTSFAFVELSYGIWTNSLGLISDSCHMFFDCTALIVGLFASIISKWRANEHYTYGYVRAEVMTGFLNGIFLVFIAFFILAEAVERMFQPPEVKHERLLVISVMGFVVNIIGIFVFNHGGEHGHSHGGDSHGHSHGGCQGHGHIHAHEHNHSHGVDQTQEHADHHHHESDHDHAHSDHKQTYKNQIFQGIFLHILADTLGSVGVIISSLCIQYFDWQLADPICSMIIAILISLSVIPLLRDSAGILMQRQPKSLDKKLPEIYRRIQQLPDVLSVQSCHFWTLSSTKFVGGIKVEVSPICDSRILSDKIKSIFSQIGIEELYIQIDYVSSSFAHVTDSNIL